MIDRKTNYVSPKFVSRLLIALAKSAALDGNAVEAREYASLALQVLADTGISVIDTRGAIEND